MFNRPALAIACALLVGGCTESDEIPASEEGTPLETFPEIAPPDVSTGWPCYPLESVETDQDKTDDDDGDNVTDCIEEFLGSDPNDPDSDDDNVGDFLERGNVTAAFDDDGDGVLDDGRGLDTDGDGILDLLDTDDDGDGIPTIDEDSTVDGLGNGDGDPTNDDFDNDGVPNYIDDDDEDDAVVGSVEDAEPAGDGDGDPRNDDFDNDGIPNYVDADDDNDTASRCENAGPTIQDATSDLDGDGLPNFVDEDDDGDNILTIDEDRDNDGDPCTDDLDDDQVPDFVDLDDDGDTVPSLDEDLNGDTFVIDDDSDGDGIPNFRDTDDDGDGFDSSDERPFGNAPNARDTDNDGTPDYLDVDDDNDGVDSIDEANKGGNTPLDFDGDGIENAFDHDDDGDGCASVDEPATAYDADNQSANCPVRFNLSVSVTGFDISSEETGNLGSYVFAVLRDESDAVIGVAAEPVVSPGDATVNFLFALVPNELYSVDLFQDMGDGNRFCDGAELSWRLDSVAVSDQDVQDQDTETDVELSFAQGTNRDGAACASFPEP